MTRKIKTIILVITTIFPPSLRIRLMNFIGYKVDSKAKLKFFSIILANEISIAAFARVDSFVIIAGLNKLVMQEYSAIQRFTYISGNHMFKINKRAMVGSRCIINAGAGNIEIGEYSALAPRSSIYTHGTFLPVTHGYPRTNSGVKIGDFCWIMQNTSIGPGVEIESNSIILPGSSIIKNIPRDTVVYDTPVQRKNFPIYFFKKVLEDKELLDLIKEITINYLTALKSDNDQIEFLIDNDAVIVNYLKKNKYKIHFSELNSSILNNKECITQIFFYYDFDIELMKQRKYVCYDFKRIINSYPKLPEILIEFDKYVFFNYGLKFIDTDYL